MLIINHPDTARAIAKAQERADETGRAYMVTDQTHILLFCADNMIAAKACGCESVTIVKPSHSF